MSLYKINHASGSSASVSFMGIPYYDYDRTGNNFHLFCGILLGKEIIFIGDSSLIA
jgi:hypothetical protein